MTNTAGSRSISWAMPSATAFAVDNRRMVVGGVSVIVMTRLSGEDVVGQGGRVGLRRGERELDSRIDLRLGLGLDRGDVVIVQDRVGAQLGLVGRDGVM